MPMEIQKVEIAALRRRAEQIPEAASLPGPLSPKERRTRPDADRGDGKAETDAEAHVKIEIIGKNRVHRSHARVPAIQDPVAKQDRIGHDGDDHADQAADHRPEREHHADEQEAQVQLNSRGHRRQQPSVWRVSSIQGIGISRIGSMSSSPETVGKST